VLLFALGLSAVLMPFAVASGAVHPGFGVVPIIVLVELALEVLALPGLFARRMSGWRLLFYARLVAIVASLVELAFVSAIVGGVIGLYLLFQVRPLYRGGARVEADAAIA
jgi:hypothetical protein